MKDFMDLALGTFDLSDKKRKQAILFAKNLIDDGLTDRDKLYREISLFLEDPLLVTYKAVSLDESVGDSEKKTRYDTIGVEDTDILINFQEEEKDLPKPTNNVSKLVGHIAHELTDDQRIILEVISNSLKKVNFHINTEELADNLENVKDGLDVLVERFFLNGKFLLPPRPVRYVSSNLDIVFEQRNWSKIDPKKYFEENIHIYGGLTRSQFARLDPGLNKKLFEIGLIDEIIPSDFYKAKFIDDPIEELKKLYPDLSEVSRGKLNVEYPTLYSMLLKCPEFEDLVPLKIRKYNGNPLKYFRENFEKYKGLKRWQVHKMDQGLYEALTNAGQLDEAIPNSRRKFGDNPLAYFQEHIEEYRGLSRYGLEKKDRSLYHALMKHKQLDQAIPKKLRKSYGQNPLDYVRNNIDEFRNLSKSDLIKNHVGLYDSLRRKKVLDEAIQIMNS